MYDFMNIEIDLAKIPRSIIKEFVRKDGSKALLFKAKINKMKTADNRGNTHTIILLDDKFQQISDSELKEKGMANAYIGKGKEITGEYKNRQSQPQGTQQSVNNDNDPF